MLMDLTSSLGFDKMKEGNPRKTNRGAMRMSEVMWTPNKGVYQVRHASVLYNKDDLLIKVFDKRTGDVSLIVPANIVQSAIVSGELDFSTKERFDGWMEHNFWDQLHDCGLFS